MGQKVGCETDGLAVNSGTDGVASYYVTYGRCTCASTLYAVGYACSVYARRCACSWTRMAQRRAVGALGSCRPGRGERAARADTTFVFCSGVGPGCPGGLSSLQGAQVKGRTGQGVEDWREGGGGRSGLGSHRLQPKGDVIRRMGGGSTTDAPAHGFSLPTAVGLSLSARKSPTSACLIPATPDRITELNMRACACPVRHAVCYERARFSKFLVSCSRSPPARGGSTKGHLGVFQ